MAFKTGNPPAPAARDVYFDLRNKNGKLTLRATTHDGKKFLLADITEGGLKLRQRNNHPHLGIAVDRNGAVRVS